ncbi:hypothetical protein BHE74_00033799 [Ensete ventricosum]|nr:hypothetical protein BHE74_00033799 [Ensete ventricosum]
MMGQDQAWASGRGADNAVGPRREFARKFTEGIGKLAGNTPRDCQKKTIRLTARIPEAAQLSGKISTAELPVSGKCTIPAQDFERLSMAEQPRLGG